MRETVRGARIATCLYQRKLVVSLVWLTVDLGADIAHRRLGIFKRSSPCVIAGEVVSDKANDIVRREGAIRGTISTASM